MKKLFVLFMVLCVMTGCTTPEITPKEVAVEHETFLEEEYVDYPGVKNIVKYLKMNPQDVKILSQTNQELVFCFYHEVLDVHDESIDHYVKDLDEQQGFEMKLYDGTISSTFVLEKENYELKMTTISDVKEWKKSNKDDHTIDLMDDENIVCTVKLKYID